MASDVAIGRRRKGSERFIARLRDAPRTLRRFVESQPPHPRSACLRARDRPPFVFLCHDEFQEAERIAGAWVPMRVDCSRRNERLSPACKVTGGLPSSCQMPVPDRIRKVIAAGWTCRGLTAPGAYSVSQTITSSFSVPGRTLFRRGVCVIPALSLAGTDTGCTMHNAPTNRIRIILMWDDFANLCPSWKLLCGRDPRWGGVAPQTALSYA
jgi:hypothetical protein